MFQVTMVCLEDLVPTGHVYRRFLAIWNIDSVEKHLSDIENDSHYKGYGVLRLFKCLLLQFIESICFNLKISTSSAYCTFGAR